MESNHFTRGRKTTYQRRVGAARSLSPTHGDWKTRDKRAVMQSSFLVTVNTNVAIEDDDLADVMGEKFQTVLDDMGYDGEGCETWGRFFKVATGRGRKWLDKKQTVPNPDYDSNYNSFYAMDDKQGVAYWCSLIKNLHMEGAGVEWAPGTKKGRNKYLHAHILLKVTHTTRMLVDRDFVAEYFQEKLSLGHKPYVHVDVLMDTTQRALNYIFKNDWNKNSQTVKENAEEFFTH